MDCLLRHVFTLQNVWVWTADHDLDASGEGQLDVSYPLASS